MTVKHWETQFKYFLIEISRIFSIFALYNIVAILQAKIGPYL